MTKPYKYLVKNLNKKHKELQKIVEAQFGRGSAPEIKVNFDLGNIRALGTHTMEGDVHQISLNSDLANELKDKYINLVFTHEYAHACVVKFYGYYDDYGKKVAPHGKEFKAYCRLFGIPGKATTDIATNCKIKTNKTKRKTFTYVCSCQEYELSTIRHNRIKKGMSYSCPKCKTKLTIKK